MTVKNTPLHEITELALSALQDAHALFRAVERLCPTDKTIASLARVGAELTESRHNLIDSQRIESDLL